MTHQEASAVVNLPVSEVDARLREISSWPRFLVGLTDVVKTAHERYTFIVVDGRSTREVPVCAIPHPREHRVSWKALAGPAFDGEFRLHPEGDRQTRVTLSLVAEPAGFLDGLSDMVHPHGTSTAEVVLQRLEKFLLAPAEPV
jgi:uncharacterized membrane protein